MNSRNLTVLAFVFCLYQLPVGAQNFRSSIPGLDTLETSFIVRGAASTVLKEGEAELIFNNQLASYWIAIHNAGDNFGVIDRVRSTQFISELSAHYGISEAASWDIGLQARYTRTRLDNEASSSPFRVFKGEKETDEEGSSPLVIDQSIGALSGIGIRVRVRPVARRPELVLSGGYSFGVVKDEDKQRQLQSDRDILDIGVSYYRSLTSSVYYYFGGILRTFLSSNITDETLYNPNLQFFLIHRTRNRKFTFYPGLAYSLNFKKSVFDDRSMIKTQEQLFAIIGLQFDPAGGFNVFVNAGLPLLITVTSPVQKIVRESYSLISLGTRIGF